MKRCKNSKVVFLMTWLPSSWWLARSLSSASPQKRRSMHPSSGRWPKALTSSDHMLSVDLFFGASFEVTDSELTRVAVPSRAILRKFVGRGRISSWLVLPQLRYWDMIFRHIFSHPNTKCFWLVSRDVKTFPTPSHSCLEWRARARADYLRTWDSASTHEFPQGSTTGDSHVY